MAIPKELTYVFLSVFFILLDLSPFSRGQEYIFPEVIKILQKINKLKEVENCAGMVRIYSSPLTFYQAKEGVELYWKYNK